MSLVLIVRMSEKFRNLAQGRGCTGKNFSTDQSYRAQTVRVTPLFLAEQDGVKMDTKAKRDRTQHLAPRVLSERTR